MPARRAEHRLGANVPCRGNTGVVLFERQPLVGRERELGCSRTPSTHWIKPGAPGSCSCRRAGIGRSRLLDELSAQSRARGHLELSGRAAEFEGEGPFGLDDWLMSLDRDHLAALGAGLESELATAFPAFGTLVSARAPALAQEER